MEADDAEWPRLVAGQAWQNQGFGDHLGVAWYRKRVPVPAVQPVHRLILYFGSVDGSATVYLNGEKIGEHLLDPQTFAGFDKPFYFDITDVVKKGEEMQIAVRVEKTMGVAGFTSPVFLIEVASIHPPE